MKIRDFDDTIRMLIFRATCAAKSPERFDMQTLKDAVEAWEEAHAEEICENIFSAIENIDAELLPNEEWCNGCDGTGLMEGWNRRDGHSCPKCKGEGVLQKEPR